MLLKVVYWIRFFGLYGILSQSPGSRTNCWLFKCQLLKKKVSFWLDLDRMISSLSKIYRNLKEVEQLAAMGPDMFDKSWWRDQTRVKKTKYWTGIYWVARNSNAKIALIWCSVCKLAVNLLTSELYTPFEATVLHIRVVSISSKIIQCSFKPIIPMFLPHFEQ